MINGPTLYDLAYAAGLIDGEGYIGITELTPVTRCRGNGTRVRKSPQHRIYVTVNMTERAAIEWMHQTFGGHFQPLKQRNPRHKAVFRWSVTSEAAAIFCEILAPHLKVKARQARLAARFYRERLAGNFQGNGGVPADELALRRNMLAEIKALNKRGTDLAIAA